jgi:benzoate membrane transport protein
LTEADLASWIFAAFAVNGILTVLMSAVFRQPLAFFWTIPGTVLVGAALQTLGFAEVIGAYLLTGGLLLVLGLTGWVKQIMDRLPMPIVMGMVAGVFVQFGLDWIRAFESDLFLVAAMTVTFFVLTAVPRLQKMVPPMIAVLVVGIVILLSGGYDSGRQLCRACIGCSPLLCTGIFSGSGAGTCHPVGHHRDRRAERAGDRDPAIGRAQSPGKCHHHRLRNCIAGHRDGRQCIKLPDRTVECHSDVWRVT